MRVRLVGLLALMALVLASCGGVSPDAAGPSEGIQVHGDWTIDIYNEDGSLDESVQFSNALEPTGASELIELLARERTVGDWWIGVLGGQHPCRSNDGQGSVPCAIGEAGGHLSEGSNAFHNLTVEATPDGLQLVGSFDTVGESSVEMVQSGFFSCTSATTASDCALADSTADFVLFTEKDVTSLDWNEDGTEGDGPVPLSDGQTAQVQVVISFTSG